MRALIDGKEIDLPADQVPHFTFAIEDSNDIAVIRGNESGDITIPATNNNRNAVGGYAIGEVSQRVHDFSIVDGTAALFDGKAYIRSRSDREIEFFAVSGNAEWISALKDKRLRDVDMGDTTTVDPAYAINTWTDTTTALYFPLVDYGNLEGRPSSDNIEFQYLRPAIRVSKFLTKAFSEENFGIQADGRFATLWPKLVMLNTNENIPIGDQYLDLTFAVFYKTTSQQVSAFGDPFIELTFPIVLNDQSSTYTGTGRYTAPFNMDSQATLDISLQGTFFGGFGVAQVTVQLYDFTTSAVIGQKQYSLNNFASSVTDTNTFSQFTLVAGREYGIRVRTVYVGGGSVVMNVTTAQIKWRSISIEYQSGVELNIAQQAPDVSVTDVIKWLCNLYCLIPVVSDRMVTLMYYDDYYRPISEGFTDLTGRVDGDVVKVTPELPTAYVFKMADDERDRLIYDLRQTDGVYAAGDHRYNTDGEVEEEEVQVGFAATAMGNVLGGLRVPVIRDKDAKPNGSGLYDDRYDWEPRLCVAEGVLTGTFKYDGVDTSVYPNCYSYGESLGGSYSTMFGNVSGSVGTVNREWLSRLRRRVSPMVACNVLWHDHELMRFDPSKAVKIHDGQMAVFCYVMEIEQHQFGLGDVSETTLTPI